MRTSVGYAGGSTPAPTYYDLADHTESFQLEFDPTQTSYEQLLEVFWQSHNPTRPAWSRQYMAAIFVHNEEQERLATESQAREASRRGAPVVTPVVRVARYHLAEDYHQKYALRQAAPLIQEFTAIYPALADLVASTAASRVNGYVAGYGNSADLEAELPGLGLSPRAADYLRSLAGRRR